LKDLPALEYLYLNTGVTDAGLKQVAEVSTLRWLHLSERKVWGPGLAELARLPRLERLCFWGSSPITDRHMQYLEGLPHLKSLTLWGAGEELTDAGLASIGKIRSLEELYFVRAQPGITPAGIAHLKKLKTVSFSQTWSGPKAVQYGDEVARQVAALPWLESVKGVGYLSVEGVQTVASMPTLKCLHIGLKDRRQGYYGPTGLPHLAGLSDLEELLISSDDPLSDADAASLESLSHLKKLCIFRPAVSERGLASIGKLTDLEYLHLSDVPRSGLNHLNGLSNLEVLGVSAGRPGAGAATDDEATLDLSGLERLKDLNLTGLPLRDGDLAFLKNLPLLDNLMVQPDPESSLTGTALRHLAEIPGLYRLWVSGLTDCTGPDVAQLNGLSKLRTLTLRGDITDAALGSLVGLPRLETLYVFTDHPIQEETVAELTRSHPVVEHIHIHELTRVQTRPANVPTNRRAPAVRSTTPRQRSGRRR
jgi:internalin A